MEGGTVTEEEVGVEVKDNREVKVGSNCSTSREEENIVVDMEMESSRL